MTRTARAESPQALIKDRSVARNGRDKSMKKNGSGAHGWGNLKDEMEIVNAAEDDEYADAQDAKDAQKVEEQAPEADPPRRERSGSTLGEVPG
jgi:hypothetical protein